MFINFGNVHNLTHFFQRLIFFLFLFNGLAYCIWLLRGNWKEKKPLLERFLLCLFLIAEVELDSGEREAKEETKFTMQLEKVLLPNGWPQVKICSRSVTLVIN